MKKQGLPFDRAWSTAYLAVGADEGRFLNLLANVSKAKNIVEFGCSYGISTIYLAAAAKDNGGHVITIDIEPSKIDGARKNIAAAGLADTVTLLEGDASKTLICVKPPVDMLFLDGAKELYLPVYQLLQPKPSAGAVIIEDNANQPEVRPFIEHILNAGKEFATESLFDGRAFVAYRNR